MAFGWATRLLRSAPAAISRAICDEGVLLVLDAHHPQAEPILTAGAIGYLQQLSGEERLQETADGLLLPWDEVYNALNTPEGAKELSILSIPPIRPLVPKLRSEGSLTSEDFSIGVDGWREGEALDRDDVSCVGALAYIGDEQALLPRASYRVMLMIRQFYDEDARSTEFNRRFWGAMRQEAVQAGAVLDQFLYSNVILTPDKLTIELQRNTPAGVGVVEVEPWFAGAPENWIQHFDSFSKVRDLYEIPTREGIIQVVITPKVKAVLQAIKAMPGRRVAGALGERFVTNPLATLGGAAEGVIDPEQFERARDEAGIVFKRFAARVTVDDDDVPTEVGLQLQSIGEEAAWSEFERFGEASELRRFISDANTRLGTGNELYHWRGHDLQMLGDTRRELETLTLAYSEWTKHRIRIRYADVSDLARYSPRVEGIGVQKPLLSPYIKRETAWDDLQDKEGGKPVKSVVVNLPTKSGAPVSTVVTPADLKEVESRIRKAKEAGLPSITWPDTDTVVDVVEAESTVEAIRDNWEQGGFADGPETRTGRAPPKSDGRKELLLRANVESAQYREDRAQQLKFDPTRSPTLPSSLLATLKDHQAIGIAWMQNLIEQAPRYCRGAILADDMGLGKTLQLLTVIATSLEQRNDPRPVLVVAPVSLLENWKEEAERFFRPGTFSMLTLYGDDLTSLRADLASLDEQLVRDGLVRFLRPDWLGAHKVVLTTYETMRDLEFSLAAIHWSIMVCDEAQKIKNPTAMVTRSAMKQNVNFKIACTGTPVENSLADLWCLFDYVQPGLLGGLNEFGARYRRPIECEGDPDALARIDELRGIIDPQILRRTKKDVAKDLPPKVIVEEAQNLPMSAYQKKLYANALDAYRNRGDAGSADNFKNVLGLIQFLRRVCTDPKEVGKNVFVPLALADYRERSPKLDWLLKTLRDIKGRGEKAIVFCEFREMQRMLVHYIEDVFRYRSDVINGDTTTSSKHEQSRQKRIRAFQAKPGFGVIILSPVAVGFGVNIQAANHVIHFSRSWNPAKEDQATDRAYRIGQTKPVYVYYPVVRAQEFKSFDVKLHELLEYKRSLSGDMLNGTGNILPNDFDDVVDVGRTVFEDRIDLDEALRLQPDYFEALVAALWTKKGFKTVVRTPASNDDGVDVVAKTQKQGELIQCKSSSTLGWELDWDAVKDVVTGHAAYRLRYPGTNFRLLCVTNQFFNEKARRMAELNDVGLIDQKGLKALLEEYRIVMQDLEKFLFGRELAA
jgi:Holliday junction resolvase